MHINLNLDTVHYLVKTYGYWLMAFGAIIEGETFLIIGGIAAAHGWIGIPGAILLAFLGSTAHDCFFFFLGRKLGHSFFDKRPKLKSKTEKVTQYFDKYGALVIVLMRFAYGFRTVTPALIGVSKYSRKKFILFDMLGGVIWSSLFILAGYFLGNMINIILHRLGHYTEWAFLIAVGLVILGFLIWLSLKILGKIRGN